MGDEKEKRKRKGERPDGLIQLSYQIGFKPDGRPDRKYFYGQTRAEALKKRDEFKQRFESGLVIDPNITVAQWVDVFKATYRNRVNEAYLKNDDAPYNRLVKKIGRMRVAEVRESHLQKALNDVKGMSFSTVDKYHQAIKRLFERARKNKIIAENPADDLIRPLYVKGTHRCLEKWEFDHILTNWSNPDARTGLWIMLMMLCGLRRGEMMALRWENVNMMERTLDIKEVAVIKTNQPKIEERAKTDAGLRTIPICQTLYDALSSVPESKRVGLVCLSANGRPLSESAVRCGIRQFCTVMERLLNDEDTDQAGRRTDIERKQASKKDTKPRVAFTFRAHDLRHTFATALYDAGVPVKAAQYFLGHADIKITLDLYTHLSKERESTSRNQMVSYLDQWIDRRVLTAVNFSVDFDTEVCNVLY